jgi:predicted DNA-binding helix-hairpin-helix protein
MEAMQKLSAIVDDMELEVTAQSLNKPKVKLLPGLDQHREARVSINNDQWRLPISYVSAGGAGPMPLLKTALTTVCENDCRYCSFSCQRDAPRQTFSPDELAAVFMAVYEKGYVRGIFLSSAILGGGVRTQDRILDTGEILRQRYGFKGYIHMKIMPGAEKAQVFRAMQLADRVSINLEAPTQNALVEIAPSKPVLNQLDERLFWVNQIRETMAPYHGWKGRWPSSSTQFVVGSGESASDRDFINLSQHLHHRRQLRRVYFSGFNPIPGTPFEMRPKQEPLRVLRLYQSAYLLRDYGYVADDLHWEEDGSLDIHKDPKVSSAERLFLHHPLEVNRAGYEQLIRIPGIGPKTARVIMAERRHHMISDSSGLKKLGVNIDRAIPFLLLNGKKAHQQLFFSFY